MFASDKHIYKEDRSTFNFLNGSGESSNLSSLYDELTCGRMARGFMFLEILSNAHRDDNKHFLKILDQVTPINLKKSLKTIKTDDEKADFILQCLDCAKVNTRLKANCENVSCNSKYVLFRKVMANIYDEVVSGTFNRSTYYRLTPYIKKLILLIKRQENNDG